MSGDRCRSCGKPIGKRPGPGRPPVFCGVVCKDAWHGRRRWLLSRREVLVSELALWTSPDMAHWVNRKALAAAARCRLESVDRELAELEKGAQ